MRSTSSPSSSTRLAARLKAAAGASCASHCCARDLAVEGRRREARPRRRTARRPLARNSVHAGLLVGVSAWRPSARRRCLLAAVATASWEPDAVLPRLRTPPLRRQHAEHRLLPKFLLVGLVNFFTHASSRRDGGVRRAVLAAHAAPEGRPAAARCSPRSSRPHRHRRRATAYDDGRRQRGSIDRDQSAVGRGARPAPLSDVLPVRTAVAIAVGVACAFVAFLPEIIAPTAPPLTMRCRALDELLRPERVVRATLVRARRHRAGLFARASCCCRFFGRRCPAPPRWPRVLGRARR